MFLVPKPKRQIEIRLFQILIYFGTQTLKINRYNDVNFFKY